MHLFSWPRDMESYDVSSKENIDKAIAPLGGSKTFTYSFYAPNRVNTIFRLFRLVILIQLPFYKSTESGSGANPG